MYYISQHPDKLQNIWPCLVARIAYASGASNTASFLVDPCSEILSASVVALGLDHDLQDMHKTHDRG